MSIRKVTKCDECPADDIGYTRRLGVAIFEDPADRDEDLPQKLTVEEVVWPAIHRCAGCQAKLRQALVKALRPLVEKDHRSPVRDDFANSQQTKRAP